ncbi:MAG: nuclear transport factor 2 family protein [Beijerinckiaceae bacterium]|nr:nuclear transport factor 2 family protein [Beijerinckiaceae bacterium]
MLAQAAGRERASIDEVMATLRRVAQDQTIGEEGRGRLFALGSWQVVSSAGRLTLLRIAEQARVDPQMADGAPHPLAPLLELAGLLDQFRGSGISGAAAMAVGRIRNRLDQCRSGLARAVIEANEPAIRTALADARTTADVRAVGQRHRLAEDGAGLSVTGSYVQRLRTLAEAEAAQAADAARRASRNAPARLPAPAASAVSPAQLAAAQRFITASNKGNEAAALAELSEDIELRTPEGVFRGKAEVREAVRRQSASGRSGTMGPPQSDGARVFARGRVGAFSVVSDYEFNSANKINRIVIR